MRSWISVPLIAQGELIGSRNQGSDRPSAFTPEAVTVAYEVANQMAIAIRHSLLFDGRGAVLRARFAPAGAASPAGRSPAWAGS